MRFLLAVALLLLSGGFAAAPAAAQAPAEPAIAELIDRLGHPAYAERRDAQRRLRSLGLLAFEDLRAASDNADPEIAEASHRLLAEAIGSWAWRDDPPPVRRWLDGYGEGLVEDRLACVVGLARLKLAEGVPALVRIARFDASELVSRTAAASLLKADEYRLDRLRMKALVRSVGELNQRHGVGSRAAAQWLDLAAGELLGEVDSTSGAWARLADELSRAAGDYQPAVNEKLIAVLRWRHLRAALNEADATAAESAIDGLLGLDAEVAGRMLSRAMQWAADAGVETVADQLVVAYADRLDDKRGLYRRAEIAARFGRTEEAERLADEALVTRATLEGGRAETLYGPRILIAGDLRRRGHDTWAIAEYQAAIDEAPEFTDDSLDGLWATACWRLADIHYDAANYAEAAAVLGPLVKRVTKSSITRDQYEKLPQLQYNLEILPGVGTLMSHERLSAALAAREADDHETEMKALRTAIRKDGDNADVVIAMYRVKTPTPAFQKETMRRLREMRQAFERRIWDWEESKRRDSDSYSSAATGLYNQWAWLVSNTEGDFKKAVRYSRRSLDFNPDQASCLDTLGRCLFSAGQVEEAAEVQRRAVELQPWVKIMRRQLDEFEAALADRTSSGEPVE